MHLSPKAVCSTHILRNPFCFFVDSMATKRNTWIDDHYTERARKEGYLARSIYKLEEIDQKYHIVDPKTTKTVLDIGCAPGSWLQYLLRKLPEAHRHLI